MAAIAVVAVWFLSPSSLQDVGGSPGVVEISFMSPGGQLSGPLDDVVRAFERKTLEEHRKDPSRPIYRVVSGQNAAPDQTSDPTRFLTSVAGGMPPDVVNFDRFAIAEWAARNAFQNLDPYIEADLQANVPGAVRPEDYYASVWDEAKYKGHVYAIPNGVDDRVLYYNKDLLRQAGIVDPATGEAKPPVTWEELREAAKKLTRRGPTGIERIGFAPNYGNSWFYMFAWMAGGEFMSADGRRCTLNDPANIRALQYMEDIYNDAGGYTDVQAFSASFQGGQLDPFIQGKVAMKIDGSWLMPFMSQYARGVDFGVAPPPMPADRLAAGAKPISWNGGWSYAIPVNAKKKKAAWEFIRFASSDEGNRVYAEGEREMSLAMGYPYVPMISPKPKMNEEFTARYLANNPRLPQRVKDGIKVCIDLIPDARFRPVTPVGQLLWNQQISAMEAALYGRKSPKEALDYATAVVQRDLDRILAPAVGTPITLSWFFAGYALLLVLTAAGAYLWDTRVNFRRGLARTFGRKRQMGEGDMVEGARGGYFRGQWLGGLLCTSPWLIGFIIFGGGPLFYSIVMSFCDYDVLSPPRFIGLRNYRIMLFEDELVPKSFWNTFVMLIQVPLGIVVGMLLAVLLNLRLRGMAFFRTACYLPAILPAVATFMLWIWIFNPVAGPLNGVLALFGIKGPAWLQNEFWSKPALIIMGLWGVGGGMIIWLAGLRNISGYLYEAAEIDGASAWQQFRHVTLPQLTPYIFFNLLMGLIAGFQRFDEAFVMTRGGPVNSSLFYVYHLFNNAFRYGKMGYACAMAWALFLVILVFTFFQMRSARQWVHYEGD